MTPAPSATGRRRRQPSATGYAAHLFALALLTGLALLLTWPLAARFATHVPGDGIDDPALAWNLWWLKTRWVDHLDPGIFQVGWMFHPIGINLAFYTLTPLNGLLSVPLQTALGLVPANNLILLSSYVLGGYGAYLLALEVWGPRPMSQRRALHAAALLGGVIYAFASPKLFYAALGQFNIASSQWIPFCILYLWRLSTAASRRAAIRSGLLAGLFMGFQAWAELTFASFLLIFAALFAVWHGVRLLAGRGAPGAAARFAWGLATAGVVFALAVAPFLVAMALDLRREGDFFASGGGFADIFSADLLGFWLPTRLHPVFGNLAAGLPFPNDKGQQLYLGYSALILASLGSVAGWRAARRERWTTLFWITTAILFCALSLGPWLRWAGRELPIPGPFVLVAQLPFFSGNRYPSRYGVMLILAAAVLATRGALWLAGRLADRPYRWTAAATCGLGLLFLVEHLAVPLPLSDFRIPALYARLAAEPGDSAILELPTGWRNGARVLGRSDLVIMFQQWYQTEHGKRRLGGNTSRNPEYKFQYFTDAPVIGDLIAFMNADRPHLAAELARRYPELLARTRALAPDVFDFLDVRYVLLHMTSAPDLLVRLVEEGLPLDLVEEWQGEDWTGAPSTIRLYSVRPPSAPLRSFDLAASESHHLLAEGWSSAALPGGPRYAVRDRATLLLDLPDTGAEIEMVLAQPATVAYFLNGRPMEHTAAGATHRIAVPAGRAGEPVDRLELAFRDPPQSIAGAAATAIPAGAAVGATGAQLAPGVSVVVRSAGEEVGDFAHVFVNGVDHAANSRGYNLVALTGRGAVLDSVAFDTHLPGAATKLAAWIDGLAPGTVVAGAVADEAGHNLTEEAVAALRTLGVTGDLRNKFRWSHAFVGVAGAAPGTALESMALIQPASAVAGLPVDAPEIFGQVRQVTVQPASP